MLKKVLLTIVDVISTLIIVLAIAMLLIVVLTKKGEAPNIGGYSTFRILTGSMEPEYPVDAMVVVKRVGLDEINVGDVISFYSSDEEIDGMVNTHRVISDEIIEGQRVLHTKGDANAIADDAVVTANMLIGKVVYKSVLIGKLVRLAANPLVFIPFIIIPLIIMLLANILDTVKATKEIMDEELKQAEDQIQETNEKTATVEEKKVEE